MKKDEIFEYKEYRAYLRSTIANRPKKGRGLRSALARAACCPVSHVSQVLSEISHLTLEQAEEVNRFLDHAKDEAEYFLLLVQLGRAGTPGLRQRLLSRMRELSEKRLVLKERLGIKEVISEKDQAVFYSSWHYQAIHILITIPRFQTKDAICQALGLSMKRVKEVLEFLMSIGLVVQNGGRYTVTESRIHLGSDSPMISKHHSNWRIKAIESLDKDNGSNDLHYSSVISISQKDVDLLRGMLVRNIEEIKGIIRESREEELLCFSLDFFKL